MNEHEELRSGELARSAGVSRDTLRHYERKGVLPRPRRATNNYRLYPRHVLERLRIIREALALGITLDELAGVLKTRDRGGAPCREVRNLAAAKLQGVEAAIRDLSSQRSALRATLRDWDRLLSAAAPGARAGLLDNLAGKDRSSRPPRSTTRFLIPKRHPGNGGAS